MPSSLLISTPLAEPPLDPVRLLRETPHVYHPFCSKSARFISFGLKLTLIPLFVYVLFVGILALTHHLAWWGIIVSVIIVAALLGLTALLHFRLIASDPPHNSFRPGIYTTDQFLLALHTAEFTLIPRALIAGTLRVIVRPAQEAVPGWHTVTALAIRSESGGERLLLVNLPRCTTDSMVEELLADWELPAMTDRHIVVTAHDLPHFSFADEYEYSDSATL